ncbi:hypothetical protein IFM89_033792 [Coptis chinensis]|uniref:Uncharacterized protein n=1 Tax=Coptis chinensis TaxID=261450 RepID=A0A835LSC2_9MAGN|nr:hypothetical protein IFM89_033792 [Coptis chinensis]
MKLDSKSISIGSRHYKWDNRGSSPLIKELWTAAVLSMLVAIWKLRNSQWFDDTKFNHVFIRKQAGKVYKPLESYQQASCTTRSKSYPSYTLWRSNASRSHLGKSNK